MLRRLLSNPYIKKKTIIYYFCVMNNLFITMSLYLYFIEG
nr:MAG TPA: hypothetical protein [Caudoviricetes sp.]